MAVDFPLKIVQEAGDDVAGAMNGFDNPMHNGDEGNMGGGVMNENEYNQDFRHDSFGAPPKPAEPNKWDDEEEQDWVVQQRQEEFQRGEVDVTSSETGGGAAGSRTDVNSPSGRSNSQSQIARAGTVRKNINSQRNDTLEVRDPEKKKFKGIKSFVVYSVIPTSTGRAVSRRYKNYDWLHDRLEEKFSIHCVPPLPDKRCDGRYGEDFVEKRREKLQRWSNRIARHPVISRSDVFIHFIHCDDEGNSCGVAVLI